MTSHFNPVIEEIDRKVEMLLRFRDDEFVQTKPSLRATICSLLEKCYFLQSIILNESRFKEEKNKYFFQANSAANRHFRDWGFDEVADIYNELREIALRYMDE